MSLYNIAAYGVMIAELILVRPVRQHGRMRDPRLAGRPVKPVFSPWDDPDVLSSGIAYGAGEHCAYRRLSRNGGDTRSSQRGCASR